MRAIITGGSGFLGATLARAVLAADLQVGGAPPQAVDELVLVDVVPPPDDIASDPRVTTVVAPLEEAASQLGRAAVVFHLAGAVSSAAEADLDLGLRANLDGLRSLLGWARAQPAPPVLVFTSSIAVFGTDPALTPVREVTDDTVARPQSSYGAQKLIGEILVADFTRRGIVRGRSLRLMTVAVRPGAPNAAASSFVSGIIREPLAGRPAVCPVPLDTPLALSSPRKTIEAILRAAALDDAPWGSMTAVNLPALRTTPREMLAALDRVADRPLSDLVDVRLDPAIDAIVGSWPADIRADRAVRLGLNPETSFDDFVRAHLDAGPGGE